MRSLRLAAAAVISLSLGHAAVAQTSGTCTAPPTLSLSPGTALSIDSRSGEVDVQGAPVDGIRIRCEMKNPDDLARVKITLSNAGTSARLHVAGGPTNNANFVIHIEVPTRTDLRLRAEAGELRVSGIEGNQDVRIKAGEIHLNGITPDKYKEVHAAVTVGEVDVPQPFPNKKAFFASFEKDPAPGKFQVHAHVIAGEIRFN